jgi:uncharacterized membrane protein YgcG
MAVVVVALLASGVVSAQVGYPLPIDKYVNDYAVVLERKHKDDLNAKLADLDKRTGIEATVLTIVSIHDYDTGDATIESFATNLFNTWGIGDRDRNDGLLILVAVRDRQVRIEVGKGYGSGLDQPMQRVIDEKMVPHFRQEDYSTGIYEGTLAAVEEITGDARSDETARISIDFDAWIGPWFVILCIVLPFGVAWLIAKLSVGKSPGKSSRKRGRRSRRGRHWDNDGPYGGGSSSDGGGGGFGGGGSSGGGASGDW